MTQSVRIGTKGPTAYQLALLDGFRGTEAMWKEFIKSQEPPVLADLDPWKQSSTVYIGVPYGQETWAEPTLSNQVLSQVMDIYLPAGPAPADGFEVVFFAHANSTDRNVGDGGTMGTAVKLPALAANKIFVTVEFRHPVTNQVNGAPHYDIGQALQFLRSLHKALNINVDKIWGILRSRGNLGLWQTLAPDMKDPDALTYAGRMSSRLNGAFCIQPQIAYTRRGFASLYVVPGDQPAVIAANPDDPRWMDAYDEVWKTDRLVPLVMIADSAYYSRRITAAEVEALGNSLVHFPDAGLKMRDAYRARGFGDQIAVYDDESNTTEQLSDMVLWSTYVSEGMCSVEALAMARAKRRVAAAHYVPDNLNGTNTVFDGSGTKPPLGGPIGAVVDGTYGYLNRFAGAPQGYGAGMSTAANRPLLDVTPTGRYAIKFADSTDRLTVNMPSDGTPNWVGWTLTGEETVLASQSTTNYIFGQSTLNGKTLVLSIGSDAAITANDMKIYRQMASAWSGVNYG